jgi:hypothetical protein
MFDKLTQNLDARIPFIFLILPLVLSLRGWQIYRTEKLDAAAATILRAAIRQTLYDQFLVAPETL